MSEYPGLAPYPQVSRPTATPAAAPSAGGADIRSVEFRKGREQGWRRLDDLVGRIERDGIASLTAREAQELPLLYRAAMSSLSVARNIALDRNLLLYLENLSLRAYLAVYGPRASLRERIREFLRRGFPRCVREMRWHLLAAFLFLMAGVAAGYVLVWSDINNFHMFVPEDMAQKRGPDTTAEELIREELLAPFPGFIETFVVFANSLFRHNAVVGMFSFALGFALGLPTLFLLLYNGVIIGAFIALHADKGLTVDFIGWLSIHGVTEILAILLCGAAGFVVAEKIIFPGALPRLQSLALHGKKAAAVVAGAVVLFFIAGILEGGFRQLITSTPLRFAFAVGTGALWLLYFAKVGKAGHDGDNQ